MKDLQEVSYDTPMLRYVLRWACLNLSGQDDEIRRLTDPYMRTVSQKNWKDAVGATLIKVVSRNLSGSTVDYIQRAARQIDQAGEIMFDDPESEVQEQNESEFDQYERYKKDKKEEKDKKRKENREKLKTVKITKEQWEKITDPSFEPRVASRVETILSVHSNNKRLYDGEFRYQDLGGSWDGSAAADCQIANSMIRNGILEVVEYNDDPRYALFKNGPNFDKAMSFIEEKRETQDNLRKLEDERNAPSYVPENFDEIEGVGVPVVVRFWSGREVALRTLFFSESFFHKLRTDYPDEGGFRGMKKYPEHDNRYRK